MSKNANSKKIARSKEDKEKQLQKIIDVGRELFISKGSRGFKTRALAERLDMTQPNLYTYIKSKRELWIAIRTEDWKWFKRKLEEIVEENKDTSYMLILEKIAIFFLDFVKNEYHRFKMMFMVSPPPSKKVGPFEENYKLIDPLVILRTILSNAMKAGEIEKTRVDYLAHYLTGVIYGMAYIEREFSFRLPISEPIERNPDQEYIEGFRRFSLQRIRDDLKPKTSNKM